MRSYKVKYMERDGETTSRLVVASSSKEARRIAAEEGCEDIISVRHAHFIRRFLSRLLVVALVVAGIVLVLRYF